MLKVTEASRHSNSGSPRSFPIIPIRLDNVSAHIARIKTTLQQYQLPDGFQDSVLVIPVSGGVDSCTLAIIMRFLFPDQAFEFVFFDTLAESKSTYETLDKLEQFIQSPISRIVPEKGLYELIEQYGGFLPSPNARWCTRELKLETFKPWLKQFDGVHKHMFVGLRADEADRLGFSLDGDSTTHFPFIEMGLVREDIFTILRETIGIPTSYFFKTRSGCYSCPFQRRSEIIGLFQFQRLEFEKAGRYEKLSPDDLARHNEALPLWADTGIALNWLSLPIPTTVEVKKAKNSLRSKASIFGDKGIFVGGEFFIDSGLGFGEFIWQQRVVSYSPTLHGLKRQLDDRYQHLLSTSELHEMTPDDIRRQVKFAIWYVEISDSVFDPAPPGGGGYTWQQGTSYRQLRHIVQWVTRALQVESMRQQASVAAHPLSVQYEWAEASKRGLESMKEEGGRVVWSTLYVASEKVPDLDAEEEAKTLPCPMCSI